MLEMSDLLRRKRVQQLNEGGIRPAKANDVSRISCFHVGLGRPGHNVIFLANRPVAMEILHHHREKLRRYTVGFHVVPIAAHAFDGQQLDRRPAERIVPLTLRLLQARRDAARLFEFARFFIIALACASVASPAHSG